MDPEITIKLKPRIGDRNDYLIRAVGPGKTDWTFKISLTGTVIAIWQTDPDKAIDKIARKILDQIGTAKKPPKSGFWFDSYNSGETLQETVNLIWNKTYKHYIKDRSEDPYVNKFGSTVFSKIKELNDVYADRYEKELFRSFDDAFEPSQPREDLDELPKDKAHFVYRICILSVIIDHFNLFPDKFEKKNGTLNGLESWLIKQQHDKVVISDALVHFRMIKKLRKQYPIHEQFTVTAEGVRTTRSELVQATEYYKLNDDGHIQDHFHNVLQDFTSGLDKLKLLTL